MKDDKTLCKPSEAAEYLRIGITALKTYEKSGDLLPYSVLESKHRRFLWADVIALRQSWERKALPDDAELMSSTDVCDYLCITRGTLRRLEEDGKLIPCLVIPPLNRRLYLVSDAVEYFQSTMVVR